MPPNLKKQYLIPNPCKYNPYLKFIESAFEKILLFKFLKLFKKISLSLAKIAPFCVVYSRLGGPLRTLVAPDSQPVDTPKRLL